MSDITSAADIAAAVNDGSRSPLETVEAALARIEALDAKVEAWTHVDADGAREAARQVAARPAGSRGALAGVTAGIKDIIDVAGMPTGLGADFARYTPSADAAAVARLKAAGAIVLGKTATTQFAHIDPAPTRNPWNLEHTPGGSSSGSAAAVAAGMADIALGTQTVGSMLRPAAFCGIVGLKATHGRVSTSGVFPVAPTLDHVGIFAHSVADAALVLDLIAGYDPADPNSLDLPADDFVAAAATPRVPRLAFARSYPAGVADHENLRHLEATAEKLAAAGATIVEVDMPLKAQEVAAIARVIQQTEAAVSHETLFRTQASQYRPHLRSMIETGMAIHAVDYLRAINQRRQLQQSLDALLGDCDAFLLPTAPGTAPYSLESTGNSIFCAPGSLTGMPAISLPGGPAPSGLPLAVQLLARRGHETTLLSAAAWTEGVLGFNARPALLGQPAL